MSRQVSGFLPAVLAALAAVAVTWAVILALPWTPTLDQASLLSRTGYPTFNQEVVPRIVVGLLYVVGPHTTIQANTLLRLVSGALYIGAAALLATRVLGRHWSRAALLALLVATGFPVLWLSSELITGALLCMSVWLAMGTQRAWLLGMALGALGLTKSEMVLVGLLIGTLYLRETPGRWRALLTGFVGLGAALAVPGIIIHRGDFFHNRSWASFGSHYAALVAPLQIGSRPDPWVDWQTYMAATFPGEKSVVQVILHHPVRYADFVALAIVNGIYNAVQAFGFVLVAIGVRIGLRHSGMRSIDKWLLTSAVVLIPELTLAFPDVRYMAKLAPLVLMVPLAEAEARRDNWRYILVGILSVAGMLLLVDRFENPGQMPWSPD